MHALGARFARALDEGERLPELPNRLLEENLWRAIRYGLADGLIDFERGEVVPARARIEALIEWVLPVAEEIGAAPYLAVPEANASERQYARLEQLGSHRDVFNRLNKKVIELANDPQYLGYDGVWILNEAHRQTASTGR